MESEHSNRLKRENASAATNSNDKAMEKMQQFISPTSFINLKSKEGKGDSRNSSIDEGLVLRKAMNRIKRGLFQAARSEKDTQLRRQISTP
ncbi:hypothetical protein Tco_0425691 [Tanacetum coccineum]